MSLAGEARVPLAVRSSSGLEDALGQPFAGVYGTKMVPGNQLDTEARFRSLLDAIKFVWASTYFAGARAYLAATGEPDRREKMAVIVQEVVGRRHGERFYPDVAGVARSVSFYPVGGARPEDGVVDLAVGLGQDDRRRRALLELLARPSPRHAAVRLGARAGQGDAERALGGQRRRAAGLRSDVRGGVPGARGPGRGRGRRRAALRRLDLRPGVRPPLAGSRPAGTASSRLRAASWCTASCRSCRRSRRCSPPARRRSARRSRSSSRWRSSRRVRRPARAAAGAAAPRLARGGRDLRGGDRARRRGGRHPARARQRAAPARGCASWSTRRPSKGA